MKSILIAGAGQLGSRHLQAIKKLDRDVSLQVLDPNPSSLSRARDRYVEVDGSVTKPIRFVSSLDDVVGPLDLCIVATNADVRFAVVNQLMDALSIRYFIFEKVLFQRQQHFETMGHRLVTEGVKAWVDCSKRYFPVYENIRNTVRGSYYITLTVTGGTWGLASNGTHFLDLMTFFSGKPVSSLRNELVERRVTAARRVGFWEFHGVLEAVFDAGKKVVLCDNSQSPCPYLVGIVTPDDYFVVDEMNGILRRSSAATRWQWTDETIDVPFQSKLTGPIVQSILDTGDCLLPDYQLSAQTHVPFLQSLLDVYRCCPEGEGKDYLPIT